MERSINKKHPGDGAKIHITIMQFTTESHNTLVEEMCNDN